MNFAAASSLAMFALLSCAILAVALLFNRYMPERKSALRNIVVWWVLYGVSAFVVYLGIWLPAGLLKFLEAITSLFQAYTSVELLKVLTFHVLLPAIKVDTLQVTSELITGAAYAFVTAAVLSALGVQLEGVLAISTVAAAILTISLQSTLGNVVGGLALQVERSIQVGDWIRLKDNREGKVAQVRWRHTTLETREGDTLVVPNITLLQETFILLGRKNGRSGPRRVVVQFHVDFRTSPSLVCQTVRDCLTSSPIPNVAKEPCLDVICLDLGRELRESMAIYQARYWLTDVALEDPTSSIVRSRVATALKRAGIPLARPSFTNFMMDSQEDDAHARTTRRQALALSLLSSLELFQLLTNEEQRHLADRLVFSPFDTGEVITRQGAVAHYLYIIQSGSVDVVTEVNGVQRTVRTLKAPDLFGEMGLMTGEPRMASVVALNPVTCFRLDKTAFDAILHARPSLAEAMAALLAKRRVELLEVRKELDSIPREQQEREKILSRIQSFFGLDN